MESQLAKKVRGRFKRALRVRKHLRGNAEKPRLSVHKSNMHIHVQLIDDESARTLASASTLEFRGTEQGRKNKESAHKLGLKIAESARAIDVKKMVFDRGSHKYHGVIAALADGVREGGIEV